MIEIKKGIDIDESALIFQAVRSSGPGGQHVNKVSSKILLICPIEKITGLSEAQHDLIKQKLKSYLVGSEIRVTSQKHRSQYSNRLDAIEKLKILLQKALKEKKPRYKTKIPRAAKEKRLKKKNIRSEIKKVRALKVDRDE
jgi:ribosome-associated protein